MISCPRCGETWPEKMRFCGLCGTPLETLKAEEERKIATVMFVDVVGFTSLSERMDVEEVEALLDRFFAAVDEAVQAEGGVVNKMMGDAALVLFGAPRALEHHALHAVRAAQRLQDWAENEGIGLHFGIHTGEILLTLMGSGQAMDFTVLGDTVNVAQRIQSLSGSNEILISETTHALVEDRVRGVFVGEVKVKNREEPVRIFRVDALVEPVRPRRRWVLPFVGREEERKALEDALSRERVLVVVIGPPGVGKTRLVDETLGGRPVRMLRALPSSELSLLGLSGEDVLLAWLDGNPDGVVWMEDFQWVDPFSLARVERVFVRHGGQPLRVVVTTRPEGEDLARRLEGTLAFLGMETRWLNLDPLPTEAVERLLEDTDIPPAQRETILAESGGIPLFVEVALQALAEQKGRASSLRMESVFAEQVDALPREEKDLLKRLSVLGSTFTLEELELLDISPRDEAFSGLLGKGFLVKEGEGFRFRHPLLRNVVWNMMLQRGRRELHRQVFDRLLAKKGPPDQLALHAFHAGLWDRAVLFGVMGVRHLLREGMARKALRLLQVVREALEESPDRSREGEVMLLEARALYALGDREGAWEKVSHLLRRDDLSPTLKEQAALLGAELQGLFGKVEEGLSLLDRAVPPIPTRPGQVALTRASLLVEGGRIEEARRILEGMVDSAAPEDREDVIVELARVYAIQADLETFEALVRRAFREDLSPRAQAYLLHWLAVARRIQGKVEEALNLHARSLELAREHGIRESWPLFLFEHARTLRKAGKAEEAEELLWRVVRLGEAYQDPKIVIKAKIELGALLIFDRLEVGEGMRFWEEALQDASGTNPFDEKTLLYNLGMVHLFVTGDLHRASEFLETCTRHPLFEEEITIRESTRIYLAVIQRLQGFPVEPPSDTLAWLRHVPSVVAHSIVSWVFALPMPHALPFPVDITPEGWRSFLQELLQKRMFRLLRFALWKAEQTAPRLSPFLREIYCQEVKATGLTEVYLTDIPFKTQRVPDAGSSTTTI